MHFYCNINIFFFLLVKSHSLISTNTNENFVVLKLDVNIDDTNKVEQLEIYAGQDVEEVVNTFCEKFNIPDIKKERLQKIVEERLNENKQ